MISYISLMLSASVLQKNKRTHVAPQVDPTKKGPPKSFVMRRGHVGKMLRRLEQDLRHVMMPHTAQNLKASQFGGGTAKLSVDKVVQRWHCPVSDFGACTITK